MNRMNLDQLVKFFQNKDMNDTAKYFESYRNDNPTVIDGWVEAEFVKDYVSAVRAVSGTKISWKEVQANVTTAIGCK